MRAFAERLIACEARDNESPGTKSPTAFPVCERLRPQLATLVGNTGVRSLFLRALAQAEAEVPGLHAIRVNGDGSLAGARKLEAPADPEELTKGGVVLVAQLLGLLVAFIGDKLVLRIVCDVWPRLELENLNLSGSDER